MIGESLLHYEILEKIGSGGMGEVYRAQDSKLRREVALKLLPPEVVGDEEKLARFEREARVLAALNHPHIGAIYGLEKDGDKMFLVLELVPGEDLGEMLKRGPLPMDQVLTLGKQIAEGLEVAHEQGIIHRDLKPQNIMLTADGSVKILDFGLAKALENESPDSSMTYMPTVTSNRTLPGVIMGTASYMSPEQARGTTMDRRTDIWAFGCVMFEMIAGRRVFDGETVSDVLASVLKTDPAWDTLPDNLPPAMRRLLERCFERDLRKRLRDIGEARIRLEAMLAGDMGEEPGGMGAAGGMTLGRTLVIALAAGLVLGAAGWFIGKSTQDGPAETHLRRYALTVTQEGEKRREDPVVSRDGKRVVFAQGGEIWIRELDQLEARKLDGIEGAEAPFWSPDGQEVAFFEKSQMWRVPVSGGQMKLICDLGGEVAGGRGAHWGDDGIIRFSRGSSGILSAPAVGGDAKEIIAINDSTEGDLHEPFQMPDGSIMFVVHPSDASPGRLVIEKDGVRQVLLDYPDRRVLWPRYDPRGYIVFERGGTTNAGVWALPFDAGNNQATGEPILIVPKGGRASTTEDGLLVYALNPITGGDEQLVWVDRQGMVVEPITEILPNTGAPALSPDGSMLAMAVNEQSEIDIWIQDLRRGTRTRMPHPDIMDLNPRWMPDGESFVFFSPPPAMKIFKRSLDATAPLDTLAAGSGADVSRDGKTLVFEDYSSGQSQIQVLDLEGGGTGRLLFTGPNDYTAPTLSPDDRFIAYVSDETGEDEIYLRTFPDGGYPQRVSLEGGSFAVWSRDGARLYFMNSSAVFEVEVGGEARPQLGNPVRLFEEAAGDYLLNRGMDVSLDGDRFIMVRLAASESRTSSVEIVVVDGWEQMLVR